MANSLGSLNSTSHMSQPGAPAALAVILNLRKKPFMTAAEIAQAKALDAKQRDFIQRGEDHNPMNAIEIFNKQREDFGAGKSDAMPRDLEDTRLRLYHAQTAIREAHCEWLPTSGIFELCQSVLTRALPIVESLLARLEAQEQKEADALEVFYQPSGTVEAVRKAHDTLKGRIAFLVHFKRPDGNPHNLRTVLREFIDWDAPEPTKTAPAKASAAPIEDEAFDAVA